MTPRFLMPATAPLRLLLIVMHILIPVLTLPAQAQQDNAMDRIAPPEQPEERNCLSKSHIRSIKTVDDDTLLFHMRGSKKYVNHLPRTCQGLTRYSLVHRTPMNQTVAWTSLPSWTCRQGFKWAPARWGASRR